MLQLSTAFLSELRLLPLLLVLLVLLLPDAVSAEILAYDQPLSSSNLTSNITSNSSFLQAFAGVDFFRTRYDAYNIAGAIPVLVVFDNNSLTPCRMLAPWPFVPVSLLQQMPSPSTPGAYVGLLPFADMMASGCNDFANIANQVKQFPGFAAILFGSSDPKLSPDKLGARNIMEPFGDASFISNGVTKLILTTDAAIDAILAMTVDAYAHNNTVLVNITQDIGALNNLIRYDPGYKVFQALFGTNMAAGILYILVQIYYQYNSARKIAANVKLGIYISGIIFNILTLIHLDDYLPNTSLDCIYLISVLAGYIAYSLVLIAWARATASVSVVIQKRIDPHGSVSELVISSPVHRMLFWFSSMVIGLFFTIVFIEVIIISHNYFNLEMMGVLLMFALGVCLILQAVLFTFYGFRLLNSLFTSELSEIKRQSVRKITAFLFGTIASFVLVSITIFIFGAGITEMSAQALFVWQILQAFILCVLFWIIMYSVHIGWSNLRGPFSRTTPTNRPSGDHGAGTASGASNNLNINPRSTSSRQNTEGKIMPFDNDLSATEFSMEPRSQTAMIESSSSAVQMVPAADSGALEVVANTPSHSDSLGES